MLEIAFHRDIFLRRVQLRVKPARSVSSRLRTLEGD